MGYRAAIVGLTEIGAERTTPRYGPVLGLPMPQSHAEAYAALGVEVAAVTDRREPLLEAFGHEWGDVWPGARRYTEAAELFRREALDFVSVVTSDDAHAEIVTQAVAAGVRGILCEKPIATSLEDADRMIAATEAAGIPMIVQFTRRWWPIYHEARRRVQAGEIGRLSRVVATWGGPRAMLFRTGSHVIDTVRFLVGSEPRWLMGALDDGFEEYAEYQGDGGRTAEREPGATAVLQFDEGVRALVTISRSLPAEISFSLQGTEGRLEVTDASLELVPGAGQASRAIRVPAFQLHGIGACLQELIAQVEAGGENSSPPRSARRTLEIVLGILESQRRGNARVDFPFAPAAS